jgi:hypothetical protein
MIKGPFNLLFSKAIFRAFVTSSPFIRLDIDQPITALENNSMTTHKYSHPSREGIAVMSETQLSFIFEGLKFCFKRLGTAVVLRD